MALTMDEDSSGQQTDYSQWQRYASPVINSAVHSKISPTASSGIKIYFMVQEGSDWSRTIDNSNDTNIYKAHNVNIKSWIWVSW